MKISKIAQTYWIDAWDFETFVIAQGYKHKKTVVGTELDDSYDFDEIVGKYKEYVAEREATEEKQRIEQAKFEEEKQKKIASMLVSSGFSFDGYTITKYSGYISGDDVIQIPRGSDGIFATTTDVGEALSEALVKIRRQALSELKEAAYALGCNAIIGVDFDYLTLDPETSNITGGTTYLPYVFCVTANGNAVVIEKNE